MFVSPLPMFSIKVYTFVCAHRSVHTFLYCRQENETVSMEKNYEDDMVKLKVKEVAEQKGISMGKLSRTSDVAYNTIKRIYDDPNYSPTVNTLARIAKALNVTVGELIEILPD